MERSFSMPLMDTHAPQLIIYETPRSKHPEGDSADRVGFEGNERPMNAYTPQRVIVCSV